MASNLEFKSVRSKYLVITTEYILPLLIIVGCITLWWGVFYTPFFALKHIECQLDFGPCHNANVVAELDKNLGHNLLRLDNQAIKTRLLSADFTIRSVQIIKELPDRLVVSLESVYPTVAAKVIGNETWIIFDDQLRVIGARNQDPNVPTVIVPALEGIFVGQRVVGEDVNRALGLAPQLAGELTGIKTIQLESGTLTLELGDGRQALLAMDKDLTMQLRTLQAVLADATILTRIRVIDVRFAQPVLR